jgi:hypothetical protein
MNAISKYFAEFSESIGRGWNRFWFTPADPLPLSVLRILTGLVSLYYLASFGSDLVRWFGPGGLLPAETMQRLLGVSEYSPVEQQDAVFHFSYLYFTNSPSALWVMHALGMLVVVLFTMGLLTRVTSVLSLVVVLAYVHRGPIIAGPLEPVLTMVLFYLCLGPAGTYFSIDGLLRRWRASQNTVLNSGHKHTPDKSVAAGVVLRLLQVHLAALYVTMALTKLAGPPWWDGEAVWWLIAHTETRLVDLTFLHRSPYLLDAWTHAIILFELSFPLLIWNRLARPLLLVVAVVMWSSLALITGLVAFCAMMLVANLAFVSPEAMRSVCSACCRSRDEIPAAGKVAVG